ncbi:hypothetical protein Dimus_037821 [Dionaea muscipula]
MDLDECGFNFDWVTILGGRRHNGGRGWRWRRPSPTGWPRTTLGRLVEVVGGGGGPLVAWAVAPAGLVVRGGCGGGSRWCRVVAAARRCSVVGLAAVGAGGGCRSHFRSPSVAR